MVADSKAMDPSGMRRIVCAAGVMLLTAVAQLAAPLAAQEPMDVDRLELKSGVWVNPETSRPHSGPVINMWGNGNLRERGTLLEGRWDGVHEWFHFNGLLATREQFVDGKIHGPSESYFKNGNLSLREMYVNGELHGAYEAYWARGRLAERGRWNEGERCGEWESFGRTIAYPDCS